MKKVFIIITAVVYAVAIIVVAFLGFKAEISNPPIYADDVVLAFETPYEKYGNGVLLYSITENIPSPAIADSENEEDEEETEIFYRYTVKIEEYELLLELFEGKVDLKCKAISHQKDEEGNFKEPKNASVTYTIPKNDKDRIWANNDINDEGFGTIILLDKDSDIGNVKIAVNSNDGSKIVTWINIIW